MAELAGVSAPTISHFENGEKDIQLSTVISILTVLGMNDQRQLIFTEQDEYYESRLGVVLFSGRDGDKIIQCAISNEALEDYFQGDKKDPVKVFQANRETIEHAARRKYLTGKREASASIFLQNSDFEY